MARSVLLQLARDSIQEVFQAQQTIDKTALIKEHPLLNEKIPVTINLRIDKELKGTSSSQDQTQTLLSNIIISAKKAAFEDEGHSVLTTSEYLHCEVELILKTPDGVLSETDPAIIYLETLQSPLM